MFRTVVLLFLLLFSPCFSIYAESVSNTNQNFTVNDYQFESTNANFNEGIRLKEIGNYFFQKKAYAKAVPYYEKALEKIPSEADIPFNLAQIYEHEKLWRLSSLYYEQTIELLKKPINYGKSQLNSYIAQVRVAKIKHIQGNTDEAIEMLNQLRKEESLMKSMYPKSWQELTNYFDTLYPKTPIRTINQKN